MRHVLRLVLPLLFGAATAVAYTPVPDRDPVPWQDVAFVAGDDAAAEAWARQPAAIALLSQSADGAWRAMMDARTGRPGMLRLTVPLGVPARGASPEELRAAVLAFMKQHAAAFGVDPSILQLQDRHFAVLLDGRLVAADFTPAPFGIPVHGARFSVRVVRGNVVEIDAERLAPPTRAGAALDPLPTIPPQQALDTVLAALRVVPKQVEVDDAGSLTWLPRATDDGPLRLQLAWQLAVRIDGQPSYWRAFVDAKTGDLVALFDDAHWACPVPPRGTRSMVKGGVLPRYPWEAEEERGLPFAQVRQGPTTIDSDLGGTYAYPGGAGDSVLQGVPITIACVTCTNPTSALAPIDTVTGDVDYQSGGDNTTGNGRSLKCERTSFYHGNRIHELARKWLPAAQVPDGIAINVNYNFGSCNGVYSGRRIFLFPDDGVCVNTGESPSVIDHEWGHGLDEQTGPGGNWGEGMADHMDMLTHRDSRGAPGFYIGSTNGLREADEALVPLKVWPAPECGGEPHCLGEVFNQADWHLAGLLRADARFDDESAWQLMESLLFNAVPQTGTLDPSVPGCVYEAYANVLDAEFGDGNVLNGVPLASILNAAYQHHGLATATPYTESAYPCATPPTAPTPTVTVVGRDATTGRPRVTLTWTSAPGMPHDVLRSETGAAYSKLLLASLPAGTNTYTDTTTAVGRSYVYALFPHVASGCYAYMESAMVTVTVNGGALALQSANVDPGGDGLLAPGETIDVVPTIRNMTTDPQTNVVAVLEPGDPLVTILQATSTVGALGPSASLGGSAWRVTLSAAADCDGTFAVPVRMTSDQGCSMGTLTLRAGNPGAAFRVSNVNATDVLPAANGNGYPEPGETIDMMLALEGIGSDPTAVGMAVTGTVTSGDPRAVVIDATASFGDVPMGAVTTAADLVRVSVDRGVPCGTRLPFTLDLSGSNGCWQTTFELLVAGPAFPDFEDPEQWSPQWVVGGTATQGTWQRTVPMPLTVGATTMPGFDVTANPGRIAWVTESVSDAPGADDVDGGCTDLQLDVGLSGFAAPTLSYWRALGFDPNGPADPQDALTVRVTDIRSSTQQTAETVTTNTPWERAEFDLERLFGYIPNAVRVVFSACDAGSDSTVEAMIDEVRIDSRRCIFPQPFAELIVTTWEITDAAGGDGDSFPEPGETIDVRVSLKNRGTTDATAVSGALTINPSDPQAAVVAGTDTWLDIPPGAESFDTLSFRIALDPAIPCGTRLPLELLGSYDSAGTPNLVGGNTSVVIGAMSPAATEVLVTSQDFDGGAPWWWHYPLRGEDDWQLGSPQGQSGDPLVADTPLMCWGTDLGFADPRFPRDGAAARGSISRLEAPPLDLTNVRQARLRFARWLDIGANERARVLVDDVVAWESAPGVPIAETAWSVQDIDISALADGVSDAKLQWEIETDPASPGGGWNVDTVEIHGKLLEPQCGCVAAPPTPLGDVLRVHRVSDDAMLDWTGTTSDAASFRILRRVSARRFPTTGSWGVTADLVPGIAWTEPDGSAAMPLVFYEVRPLNPCGDE